MSFTATESSSAPIVLGKEPVDKPSIHRGGMAIGTDYIRAFHDDASITFELPTSYGSDKDFLVTYHRAPITDVPCSTGMVSVTVFRETVVTWEELAPSN